MPICSSHMQTISGADWLSVAIAEKCTRCQSLSSQPLCQTCMLLENLNQGVAKVQLGGEAEQPPVGQSHSGAS